jgi:aminoglycoside phosphotransferase
MAELSADIKRWIEQVTQGQFTGSRQIAAGGRHGYLIDVARDAETLALFLQLGRVDGADRVAFLGTEREAEVFRALAGSGIPIPKVWGVNADQQAFLVERVRGTVWMHPPATPEEQLSVAQDFIRHLATWHRLDPSNLDLPSFKPVLSARDHQKRIVRQMRAQAMAGGDPIEPILRISLDFLERKLPDYQGPTVLVQGDTGPGNFMYENGKVSGVIDWELAHLGDPMDDIAWLTWRTTQHTFTHLPDRLREYEALSGFKIDDARVIYYRVNACVRLASVGSGPWGGFGLPGMGVKQPRADSLAPVTAESDRSADGSAFVFTILHRRMRLEALMAAIDLPIPPPMALEEAPTKEYGQMYEDILAKLQIAVKRTEDKTAANLMKGIARSVKYLKEVDRNGALFDQLELEDISGIIRGRKAATLNEARQALYTAAVDRIISDEAYILYHWRRLLRDEQIMRVAAGSIYRRSWPALH